MKEGQEASIISVALVVEDIVIVLKSQYKMFTTFWEFRFLNSWRRVALDYVTVIINVLQLKEGGGREWRGGWRKIVEVVEGESRGRE